MIADELAVRIANQYIFPGFSVLDPFCGTARTLVAAAERGAATVGFDVNPLAILIAAAKTSAPDPTVLRRLLNLTNDYTPNSRCNFELTTNRKVKWFSKTAHTQISELLQFINKQKLGLDELVIVATILSATVRDVSYCRKDQWKLHRMSGTDRMHFRPDAWKAFRNRLRLVIQELDEKARFSRKCDLHLQDIRFSELGNQKFDVVFTSPPYGDSQTTVQYGGISTLCLDVLSNLENFPLKLQPEERIDTMCLGGNLAAIPDGTWLDGYWNGPTKGECFKRVAAFLADMQVACERITASLKSGGHAIWVVARRTVSGHSLKLDLFLKDIMRQSGARVQRSYRRLIKGKLTPFVIHRKGHSGAGKTSALDHVSTMKEEFILVFQKQ